MSVVISGDVYEVIELWQQLKGMVQVHRGDWTTPYYLKLMHCSCPCSYDKNQACVVVDMDKEGAFLRFSNVRISEVHEWKYIYSEVVEQFDPYLPTERYGDVASGREGRVECTPIEWRPETILSYLEITLQYWQKKTESP